MQGCAVDQPNCGGKYIKQIEAQPWELAVVFIMMGAAIIFVIHFVFFTGGSAEPKTTTKSDSNDKDISSYKPAPMPKPKQFADKAVQTTVEEEKVSMGEQYISAQASRRVSPTKQRGSSPQKGLSPVALRHKGTSSGFDKMMKLSALSKRFNTMPSE